MAVHKTLTVALELRDSQVDEARNIIHRTFLEPRDVKYHVRMAAALPALHFMAIVIFEDDIHDPLLTIEVNFDGDAGPFFAALEHEYGEGLRDIIRCGKRPRSRDAGLYDAVTAPGSREPVAALLEACAVRPLTPYRGAHGFSRHRILTEARLYENAQKALGDGTAFAGASAASVHQVLRADPDIKSLLATSREADDKPWRPGARDWARLAGVLAALVILLGLPGFVLASFLNPIVVLLLLGAGLVLVLALWRELRTMLAARVKIGATAAALAAAALLALVLLAAAGGRLADFAGAIAWLLSGLASAGLVAAAILAALRARERTDPVREPAKIDARTQAAVAAMAEREDQIGQNHMGSALVVKPGALRSFLLQASHALLGSLARTVFSDGFLGPMRTIHFAHWCLVHNGSRLLFFSNFDGSWDSYLSDFTEKASGGVNLAWANCIGFPETTFILEGGSQQGRSFKLYARRSMAPTLVWFSAYRDLSVNHIHRNARVAAGLRAATLTDEGARAWARDL
jgi:hypothetical protein